MLIIFSLLILFTSACNHGAIDNLVSRGGSRINILGSLSLFDEKPTIVTAWHQNWGDERVLIAEQHGVVWALDYNAPFREDDEVVILDISDDTMSQGELGLLGMTFSPDGKWLYISYSDIKAPVPEGFSHPYIVQAIKVSDLDGSNPKGVQRTTIITVPQTSKVHNGGDIAFSPKDGYLYISLGDSGGANDQFGNAQNLKTLNGSILRIAPTPKTGGYEIPPDNPFVNHPNGDTRPEVWAHGIRNAWRIAFDEKSGDLWVNDVGLANIEEVNLIPNGTGGANLGWPLYEGSSQLRNPGTSNHHLPVFEYGHTVAEGTRTSRCAITGGQIYNGKAIPVLVGKYIYADFCVPGAIWAIDPVDISSDKNNDKNDVGKINESQTVLIVNQPSAGPIVNFGKTPTGEVIVGTHTGTFLLLPVTTS